MIHAIEKRSSKCKRNNNRKRAVRKEEGDKKGGSKIGPVCQASCSIF
jgi:hypothetical protein